MRVRNRTEFSEDLLQDLATIALLNERTAVPILVLTPTDTTTNINQASFTQAPVFGEVLEINANGDFTVLNEEEIEINFDGFIEINANVHYRSNGQRAALQAIFTLDDEAKGAMASTGYIRGQTNHREASLHHANIYLAVSTGQILKYKTKRESSNTNACTLFTTSQISIKKVIT